MGLRQTFIEPPTLVRIDPKSKKVAKLSTVNDALLAGTALGTYESVTYTGADGKPIQMWVNYPPGFDKSKKYPLFMLIHGGPHNAITNAMQFRWNAQVFGSWGYVTAWPNFHGSSGFGNAFTDSINPDQDALPYQDVIAAANWFGAAAVDRRRPHGRGRRQLRRLPHGDHSRAAAPVQGAGRARRRLQPLHAGRRGLRRSRRRASGRSGRPSRRRCSGRSRRISARRTSTRRRS